MSAIFGIVSFGSQPLEAQWLEQMQSNLQHRGPDGKGLWQDEQSALGHLLLQVTPESRFESGPLLLEHLVVTADARLDEREALMDKLRVPDSRKLQITDPELIGLAYLKWQDRAVTELTGDFAFAIWDKQERRLFCARDPLGLRPFLYACVNGILAWSTEMKALVDLPFVPKELSREFQLEYACGFQSDPETTIWKAVRRLRPAHLLQADAKGTETRPYWDAGQAPDIRYRHRADYVEAFRERIIRAVEDRVRTEYEVGSTLSGGLDSSAVTCIAARYLKTHGRRVSVVSSVLPEKHEGPETDERLFIEAVLGQESNLDPHYVYGNGLEYGAGLPGLFGKHYDLLNGFYYMDEAIFEIFKKKNTRIVLSGYFGDMAASSKYVYPFAFMLAKARFGAFARHFQERRKATGFSAKELIRRELLLPVIPDRIKAMVRRLTGRLPDNAGWENIPVKWQAGEETWVRDKWAELTGKSWRFNYRKALWPGNEDHFQEEWDCSAARHGFTIAYPLADRRILDFLLGIPPEMLQAGGQTRGLFREAITGIVPDFIATRPDKGVYVPQYQTKFQTGLFRVLEPFSEAESQEEVIDLKKLKKMTLDLVESGNTSIFIKDIWSMQYAAMVLMFRIWAKELLNH